MTFHSVKSFNFFFFFLTQFMGLSIALSLKKREKKNFFHLVYLSQAPYFVHFIYNQKNIHSFDS